MTKHRVASCHKRVRFAVAPTHPSRYIARRSQAPDIDVHPRMSSEQDHPWLCSKPGCWLVNCNHNRYELAVDRINVNANTRRRVFRFAHDQSESEIVETDVVGASLKN